MQRQVRLRLRAPPHSPSRTEIFLPFVETPRIGAVVCDRSVSANVRSDFGYLLHTFVSGGKIPFPGRRDRSERGLGLGFGGCTAVSADLCMATELYSEQPETGVERKIRATSGLVRYDAKNETLEWPRAVKDGAGQ
jgi:hypothetical protein